MPWPMRWGLSCSTTAITPSAPVPRGLAGVDGGLQPGLARALEEVLVGGPPCSASSSSASCLGAGEVDAHHAAAPVLDGLLQDDRVEPVVELAGQAEDEPRLHAVLEHRPVHAPQRGVDDVVQVQLGVEVALHRVEAQLDLRHPAAAVLLADDLVDRALDGHGRALNLLGPGVHDLQVVVEAGDLVRPRGDQLHELEVVLHRQLEALLVGDATRGRGAPPRRRRGCAGR